MGEGEGVFVARSTKIGPDARTKDVDGTSQRSDVD